MTATHDSILKVDRRGRLCDSAEQRSALVEAYPSSGLSAPRFAAPHGVAYQPRKENDKGVNSEIYRGLR